jgi:pantothenate kinase
VTPGRAPCTVGDSAAELLAAAEPLLEAPGRRLLGLAGAPGSGKSTVAERLAAAVGPAAVVVPMDGFHLTDEELSRLALADRKGAPETFDVAGYLHLLRRLRTEEGPVYAPSFDRHRELAVAGAVAVRPEHQLVVTEGNYLLLDRPGWREVPGLLDAVWFVQADEEVRVARLVRRHVAHGRSRPEAEEWVRRSDEANARLVAPGRTRADLVVARR